MDKNFDKLFGFSSMFHSMRKIQDQLDAHHKLEKMLRVNLQQNNYTKGLKDTLKLPGVISQIQKPLIGINDKMLGMMGGAVISRELASQASQHEKLKRAIGIPMLTTSPIYQIEEMLRRMNMVKPNPVFPPVSDLNRWLKNIIPEGVTLGEDIEEDKEVQQAAEIAADIVQKGSVDSKDLHKVNDLLRQMLEEQRIQFQRMESRFDQQERTIETLKAEQELNNQQANKAALRYFIWSVLIAIIISTVFTVYADEIKHSVKSIFKHQDKEKESKLSWNEMADFLMLTDARVCHHSATMRINPRKNAAKTGFVPKGQIVTVLMTNKKWIYITYINQSSKEQKSGWVYKKYFTKLIQ